MKLIAQVKLLTTAAQATALRRTLEVANDAANYASGRAWESKVFGTYALHRLVYRELRERFSVTAQIAVRVIAKVADAYAVDKNTKRAFRPKGSIAYDDRILHWYVTKSEVSIWTVDGRLRIGWVCGKRQSQLLLSRRGESDLMYRNGSFFLLATCDAQEPPSEDVHDFLGVDLGIRNIAADSDGQRHSGGHVNGLRLRYSRLREKLQARGTKAARRLLRKRHHKESLFAKQVNHRIAKQLVAQAKDTGRGIALEDLTGIRFRRTVRKAQRRQRSSWSFCDLRGKIMYKARLAGVPVMLVDPRNTSRTCPVCGCVDKHNRLTQSQFSCVSCGYSAHADTTAARIIASRAAVNRPDVSDARLCGE